MDSQQFQKLLDEMRGLRGAIEKTNTLLVGLARSMRTDAPNYQRPLSAYRIFDWASIGALIIESDASGPTRLEYNGHHFTRRNGAGKFGEAIWFSRPTGKNSDGSNRYDRLITFKDYSEAEELDGRVQDELETEQETAKLSRPATAATPPPPAPKPRPAATKPKPATTAEERPKTNPGQLMPEEWLEQAAEAIEAFDFDVCVSRAMPDFYVDADRVLKIREMIAGPEWTPVATGAAPKKPLIEALAEYRRVRQEEEAAGVVAQQAHKEAKTAALNKFNQYAAKVTS